MPINVDLGKKTVQIVPKKAKKISEPVREYVKKAIRNSEETKEIIQSGTASSNTILSTSTWASQLVNSMGTGTSEQSRVGSRVKPMYLKIGGHIGSVSEISTTNPFTPMSVRVVVVQMRRGFGISEVIADLPTTSGTVPLNRSLISQKCSILKDHTFVFNPKTNVSVDFTGPVYHYITDAQTIPIRWTFKNLAHFVWEPNSTGDSGPDVSGAIYVLYLSNYAGDDPALPVVFYQSTMGYLLKFKE